MNAPPFVVGDEVEKAVTWQLEPVRGRIVSVDGDAPLGLCYGVERAPGNVWHFSSLHMRRV